jgi:hypothetical protein
MNTFVAGKLGEVLAFARIGSDTLEKGKKGFAKIMDEDRIDGAQLAFDDLEEAIEAYAAAKEVSEKVAASAKEAEKKITDMRDTYIDGKWDEESEVLEWMGFYGGAALVHWHLLAGASENDADLKKLSATALTCYSSLFVSDEKMLREIGARAAA